MKLLKVKEKSIRLTKTAVESCITAFYGCFVLYSIKYEYIVFSISPATTAQCPPPYGDFQGMLVDLIIP